MDIMHISAEFISKIAEGFIKRWLKKNVGIDPELYIRQLSIDLEEDTFCIKIEANGSIKKAERKKLAEYLILNKWKKT